MVKTLREVREELKLSPEQVAVALGVGYGTVLNWEKGRSSPRPDVLDIKKYLELYQLSLDEFIEVVAYTQKVMRDDA